MITHTAAEIAHICGATLEGDGNVELVGPAALGEASGNQISFARDGRFVSQLQQTRAGAVIVPHDLRSEDLKLGRPNMALLRVENPSQAFSKAIATFLPLLERPFGVIEEGALIDPSAQLEEGCSVAGGASVGKDARIGRDVILYPGCAVGAGATIGAGTVCHPNVVIYAGSSIGERCILHAGCVIGADGFGFDPTPRGWEKVPQCGTVEIGCDVEIGANSTIDCGRFGPTKIGNGCKLDNLVHLAHNVVLEDGVLLAAQVGIAGSTTVQRGAILGGQVGVGGHLRIGAGARVGGQAGVTASIEGNRDYWGLPARDKGDVLRSVVSVGRLPEMRKLMQELAKRVEALESNSIHKQERREQ